jgi:hypothetical protein
MPATVRPLSVLPAVVLPTMFRHTPSFADDAFPASTRIPGISLSGAATLFD